MTPVSRDNRVLILARGKHEVRVFKLPDNIGGPSPRARLTLDELRVLVRDEIGSGAENTT
jgi:hypothetical protein